VKIAFIGVGNIGRPMAEHLRAAGHDVVVYDVRREAAASLVSAGAAWAESPRAAVTGCAIVATCLPGPAEMERVTLGPDGIRDSIAPGAVYDDPPPLRGERRRDARRAGERRSRRRGDPRPPDHGRG
jgi:3-hydroxyisobutyrate dehydrogenase